MRSFNAKYATENCQACRAYDSIINSLSYRLHRAIDDVDEGLSPSWAHSSENSPERDGYHVLSGHSHGLGEALRTVKDLKSEHKLDEHPGEGHLDSLRKYWKR